MVSYSTKAADLESVSERQRSAPALLDTPLRLDLAPPPHTHPLLFFLLHRVDFRRGGLSRARTWEVVDEPLLPVHRSVERRILVAVAAPAASRLGFGVPDAAQPGSVRPRGKPLGRGCTVVPVAAERCQGLRRLLSSPAGLAPGVAYLFLHCQASLPFPACLGKAQSPLGASPISVVLGARKAILTYPFMDPPIETIFHLAKTALIILLFGIDQERRA